MTAALLLSVLIGVALGLLGGGGSILTTPILIYALGVETKPAIATSLLVVGITSLSAVIQHARSGNVVWRTGLVFGAAGMAGAYTAGFAAAWVPDRVLLVLFAMMMLVTSVAMFRGRSESTAAPGPRPLAKIVLEGLVVGAVTGLVGAGGGFLVVPALVILGGLPMQKAVGTSLLVVALKSFAGFAGHATHVTIDYELAALVSGAAVAGSLVGAALAGHIPATTLRRTFAGFVLVMGGFVLVQQV